jgi:hypothetical protein
MLGNKGNLRSIVLVFPNIIALTLTSEALYMEVMLNPMYINPIYKWRYKVNGSLVVTTVSQI